MWINSVNKQGRVTYATTAAAKLAVSKLDHTSVMGNIIKAYIETNAKGEFGLLPLKEITNVNIINFWKHLENKQTLSQAMFTNIKRYGWEKSNTLCNNSDL